MGWVRNTPNVYLKMRHEREKGVLANLNPFGWSKKRENWKNNCEGPHDTVEGMSKYDTV